MSMLTNSLLVREIRMKLWRAMQMAAPQGEQGTFSDPADLPPVDSTQWEVEDREAFTSPEMETFRASLRDGDRTVRESLLDDLATYHGITPQEARDFCLHWEQKSVEEWASTGASTSDAGRVEFYRTTQSWSFDLTWWAYLQSECRTAPSTVLALRFLQQYSPGRRHLDFGSGVGVTSQLFNRSGWRSTSADLSSTLLDFARHRHKRRGDDVAYIDLLTGGLPAGNYDAITAIDTLAHVPDMFDTCRRLHDALGPDGVLVANSISGPRHLRLRGISTVTNFDRSTICGVRASPRSATSVTGWWPIGRSETTGPATRCGSFGTGSRWSVPLAGWRAA
ncbi:bifunctional 2-polyprenyl-6-hydroxyphenol methylase/3-demethylubiquinol 3-O-methyltransferase UbiG [Pseudonocardia sp. N23]|uniref:class I SAM-dependent methyltransferase n=1 Tax=Pseudonocardia sp. N23 TaxID=1987376 RepID=UPI00209BBF59|nr:class I SAM-dependent methyltransferase [Pseudonocardia sp. N23]